MEDLEKVRIGILRIQEPGEIGDSLGAKEHHKDRKDIVNGIIASLGAIKDMNEEKSRNGFEKLDDEQTHEYVEIAINVLPIVIPLITELFRWAVKRKGSVNLRK